MASLTWWTWVWVSSGSWWWTGRPSMMQSMGLQRVRHNWATELSWRWANYQNIIMTLEEKVIFHIIKKNLRYCTLFSPKSLKWYWGVVFQSLSHVHLLSIPWTAGHQASLSFTISWSLLKLISIEPMMPSSHLILCHPLLLLPSVFPSIRVFSNELAFQIRLPKYWSFSFSISPSNEYLRLISFRVDWFVLLAVQGTLKSLLQHHSSKASILQDSAFFIV